MLLQENMIQTDTPTSPIKDFASKPSLLPSSESSFDFKVKSRLEKLGEILASINFLFYVENKFQESSSPSEVKGFFEILRSHAKQVAATLQGKTTFAMTLEPEAEISQWVTAETISPTRKLFASAETPPNSYQKKIERAIRPLAYEITAPQFCYAAKEDIQEVFHKYYYPTLFGEIIRLLEENEDLNFDEYLQEIFFKPYLSTEDSSALDQYALDTEKKLIALQLNLCFLEQITSKKTNAEDPEQVKRAMLDAIMQTSLCIYDRFSAREEGDGKIQTQSLLPCMLLLYIMLNYIKPVLKSDFYSFVRNIVDKRSEIFFDRFFYSFIEENKEILEQESFDLIKKRTEKMIGAQIIASKAKLI
jgi:hypothetical protein